MNEAFMDYKAISMNPQIAPESCIVNMQQQIRSINLVKTRFVSLQAILNRKLQATDNIDINTGLVLDP